VLAGGLAAPREQEIAVARHEIGEEFEILCATVDRDYVIQMHVALAVAELEEEIVGEPRAPGGIGQVVLAHDQRLVEQMRCVLIRLAVHVSFPPRNRTRIRSSAG